MMIRTKVLAMLMPLAIVAVLVSDARAEKKAVKLDKEWTGSVEDEALAKDTPAVIGDAKALERLWKAWKIEGKVPDVDFKKQLRYLDWVQRTCGRASVT
jgi:hypothetical protein